MKSVERQWLEPVPWENVVAHNKILCNADQVQFTTNEKALGAARHCWEAAVKKSTSLTEVLLVCRKCHDLAPFVFNNGNTFGSIAKTLIEDWLRGMPPLEAQIVRGTVSHYVVGLVGKRELNDVLKHFEPVLKKGPAPRTPAAAQSSDSTTTTASIQTAPASQAV